MAFALTVDGISYVASVLQGDCLADMPKLLNDKYDVPIANMYVMAKGKKVLLNDLRTS